MKASRWIAGVSLVVLLSAPAAARDKTKIPDLVWIHPAIDSLNVQSVALLPAVSFDRNRRNETLVEGLLAQSLQPAGYRWVSPRVARDAILAARGDSGLAALQQEILTHGRVDSIAANRLCRSLRTEALMSIRLDQFEQMQVEWNQSGKPSTTVRLRAALVDSSGRLLWSASGSETGEGQYHEADASMTGVKSSGLGTTPSTAQGGAPAYPDVIGRLLKRWAPRYPTRTTAAATPKP
jgi:hypothetical protein